MGHYSIMIHVMSYVVYNCDATVVAVVKVVQLSRKLNP